MAKLCVSVLVAAVCLHIFVAHFTYSPTGSVGERLFWRVKCPEHLERYQLVEVIPNPGDPFIPSPARNHLAKHIGCFGGEELVRVRLHFWCRTRTGRLIDLGKTKLRAVNGKALHPYTWSPKAPRATVVLPKNDIFVIGDTLPHSYDSRYFGPLPRSRIYSCLVGLL